VSGTLHNTGQTVVFRVDKDTKHHVNISGGPLTYRYQFEEIYIHYGTTNHQGSEHRIHGYSFPGEVSFTVVFKTARVTATNMFTMENNQVGSTVFMGSPFPEDYVTRLLSKGTRYDNQDR
jgi:hypothetical protein